MTPTVYINNKDISLCHVRPDVLVLLVVRLPGLPHVGGCGARREELERGVAHDLVLPAGGHVGLVGAVDRAHAHHVTPAWKGVEEIAMCLSIILGYLYMRI